MPYNIYETARLIQAVEGINPADSFLRDRYFPSNGTADIFNSEKVLCAVSYTHLTLPTMATV